MKGMTASQKGTSGMDGMLERVQSSFHSAFDVDPKLVTLHSAPGDIPGWDSMGHITLVNSLEEEFGLSFDVDELMAMENVKEIVKILEVKLGTQ